LNPAQQGVWAAGEGIDQAPVMHYPFRGHSFTLVPVKNLSCQERLMANEVVVKSGKTLRVADEEWLIVESAVAPVVPSLFVEARHFAGVVYLSLAQTVVDVGNPPEARVCARLRFDIRLRKRCAISWARSSMMPSSPSTSPRQTDAR
jgi:hypothetical protein